MPYDPFKHHRQSYRLQGYDYASEGAYYVTMCTRNRECALGDVINGEMRLSETGQIVQECWLEIPNHFTNVTLDEYQVMPNHVHGIIVIWGKPRRDLINQIPIGIDDTHFGTPRDWPLMKNPKQPLGKIIRHFKAKATKTIHDVGFGDFGWQSKFHDHIIHDEADLERIRDYIKSNPLSWSQDEENPDKRE